MSTVPSISEAFVAFVEVAPGHAQAWMTAVDALGAASALEPKTAHLAYIAVLAAMRLEGGVPFHVQLAKKAGASRAEVVSAILLGLPAAGNCVMLALSAALAAYDAGCD
jgi:alkylhydroperoxidase/carboxymuconolactone decarboxylase family protein YurZ